MASAHDVAAYILDRQGGMSTWKLQKLVYYAQAWHLVWDDQELFAERIEAWANGPVVADLYRKHRGSFSVSTWRWGSTGKLSKDEVETIDAVLNGYGSLSGRQLSHLTHSEAPWLDARAGLGPTDRSNNPISPSSMAAFYTALDAAQDAQPVQNLDWDDVDV